VKTPTTIGRYQIRGVLGRGGMGVVYDAEDETGRRVAIKTVLGLRQRYVSAVRREIRALLRLHHQGIVSVLDEGIVDGAPWYAMEYLEGLSMRVSRHEEGLHALAAAHKVDGPPTQVTSAPTVTHAGGGFSVAVQVTMAPDVAATPSAGWRHGTSPSQGTGTGGRIGVRVHDPIEPGALPHVLRVARRLCRALDYLHGEGLVHRDLKPDNVIVRAGGWPVLVDFGLVTWTMGRLSRESVDDVSTIGAGTAAYMAPEQVQGEPVDARVDLYALGCILYELIRGQPPFIGDSVAALLHQHVRVAPEPLRMAMAWLPVELDELVLSLLAKRRQDRPGHAASVATALARIGAALGDTTDSTDTTDTTDTADIPDVDVAVPIRGCLYRPALAGRAQALAALTSCVNTVRVKGAVVVLVGESGVGKTRLALEAARRAPDAGGVVLSGQATVFGTPPLGPLRRTLQFVAEQCVQGGAERLGQLLGNRARVLSPYEPTIGLAPGYDNAPALPSVSLPEARVRLFDGLLETLQILGRERPLVIVLDDLQWADELTIGFLEHVASQERLGALVIIGTVRAEEADGVAHLLGLPLTRMIEVKPLAGADVEDMMRDALGGAALSPSTAAFIVAHARGLPFSVSEYLHAVVEAGGLERDPAGGWRASAHDVDLPTSTVALVGRRLTGLGRPARLLVDAVAVAGRAAEPDLLGALSGLAPEALLDELHGLRRRGLLDDEPGDDDGPPVRFAHDKLAEAARGALDPAARLSLHAITAATLERLPDDEKASRAAELALHHAFAGDLPAAIRHLRIAGERARTLSSSTEAVRLFERAAALQEQTGDVDGLARTLMKLGLVHTAAFEPEAAQRAHQRAFALWAELRHGQDGGAAPLPTAVVRVTNGEPSSLDPARGYDSDSLFVTTQLFEGLVEIDVDANVLPALATDWDVFDDGCRYVFHLRPGARWSDGVAVTASDFEQAWKRVLHPRMRSPVAQLLSVLEGARDWHEGLVPTADAVGVRALSSTSLELRLHAPSACLLELLSHPATFPVPVHTIRQHGPAWTNPANMVGNGAFVLEEHTPEHLVLRRNPGWTGQSNGNVGVVEVRHYPHYRDALAAWQAGALDILDLIAADAAVLEEARTHHAPSLRFLPLHSTQFVMLRADKPPFDDVRVRKALALAIDRDALERSLQGTAQLVARGGFIPPGVAGHTPTLALPYDVPRARALLAEAGFATPSALPPLLWLNTHGVGDTTLLEHAVSCWRALGVTVEVRDVDWHAFEHALANDPPHAALGGWLADYPDPDTFLRACFHSSEGAEHTGWQSARFDELAEDVARIADPRSRVEQARLADHLLVAEEVAVIPLCYGQNPVLLGRRVKAYPAAGSYLRPLKAVVVDED